MNLTTTPDTMKEARTLLLFSEMPDIRVGLKKGKLVMLDVVKEDGMLVTLARFGEESLMTVFGVCRLTIIMTNTQGAFLLMLAA